MNILVIANSFPPLIGAEAICSGKFVLGLIDHGHKVKVITQGRSQRKEIFDTSDLWKRFHEKDIIRIIDPPSVLVRKASSLLTKYYYQSPAASWWTRKAVKKGLQFCKKERFDVIVARGTTIECLYVGYTISVKTGTKLVCVLSDPPSFCYPPPYRRQKRNYLAKRIDLNKLREILKYSSLSVFPSSRLLGYLENILKTELGNSFISPHIGLSDQSGFENRKLIILHAGKIDKGRSSIPFLRSVGCALRLRPYMEGRLQFDFFGVMDDFNERVIKKNNLSNIVKFHGLVNYDGSLKLIGKASVLLLIEAILNDGIFLPSKFCDYAVSKKPIICFSPRNGTIADLLGETHPGLLGQKVEEVTNGLIHLFNAWTSKKGLEDYSFLKAESFTSDTVISEFVLAIRDAI